MVSLLILTLYILHFLLLPMLDDELKTIFKTASEEHLQNLDDGLLHLEKHPDDRTMLEALMREAHSLKGDANMLGIKDVGTLAHQFEDLLGSVKRGETTFSSQVSDRLYRGVNAIRQCVQAVVTGMPSDVNLVSVMAYMMGASEEVGARNGGSETVEDVEAVEDLIAVAEVSELPEVKLIETLKEQLENAETTSLFTPTPPPAVTAPSPHVSISSPSTYRIDTIRVETKKLDALMTQVGELTVTKTRLDRRPIDIEQLLALWEDWSRDTIKQRTVMTGGGRQRATELAQMQNYYQASQSRLEQLGQMLHTLRSLIYEDRSRMESVTTELEENIQSLRLLPLSTIFQRFPRMVRDLAQEQGKQIELVIQGGETRVDKRILEEMKDPLMHLIRNAIDHGIELPNDRERLGKPPTATLFLRGYQTATSIVIEVADDGRGLNLELIERTALQRNICRPEELAAMSDRQIQALIFTPGFSTRSFVTEVSGRGVGLDVVRTNVEQLKGTIQVDSTPGVGAAFRMHLRTTLATAHVLTVLVDDIFYAIPVEFVETTLLVQQNAIFTIKGRESILLADQPISVSKLADLLELPSFDGSPSSRHLSSFPCIVLKVGEERLGLLVDALLDEQDVVLKPQSKLLQRVRNVSGATILGTGEVCMVLNPQDLIRSVQKKAGVMLSQNAVQFANQKRTVLLVEDSVAIRTQEKRILEGAGYEVVPAVDGVDALSKLPSYQFDAIVSDVQMPNMDGLTLAAQVRQHKQYNELPIILVTSLASDEDKRRGADAGANAYITKGTFDQTVLLETLKRLV